MDDYVGFCVYKCGYILFIILLIDIVLLIDYKFDYC